MRASRASPLAKTGMVVVAGEITTNGVSSTSRRSCATRSATSATRELGHGLRRRHLRRPHRRREAEPGHLAGRDRRRGLHKEQGAGDQGLMFGYASDETPNLMPAPIDYAHQLAQQLAAVRKNEARSTSSAPTARRRSRSSTRTTSPVRIDAIVVSTQHDDEREVQDARARRSVELVIEKVSRRSSSTRTRSIHVNPTGRFVDRRPAGRLRPHRPQDHRRHLRRHGPSRRRRVQRARTRARSIARPATTRASSRRTSSPRASRAAARCRSRTRSASRSRSACT